MNRPVTCDILVKWLKRQGYPFRLCRPVDSHHGTPWHIDLTKEVYLTVQGVTVNVVRLKPLDADPCCAMMFNPVAVLTLASLQLADPSFFPALRRTLDSVDF